MRSGIAQIIVLISAQVQVMMLAALSLHLQYLGRTGKYIHLLSYTTEDVCYYVYKIASDQEKTDRCS